MRGEGGVACMLKRNRLGKPGGALTMSLNDQGMIKQTTWRIMGLSK